jgi:large subunit ribosomal protein L6
MSRIGRRPIELPSGVLVAISPGRVQVNGPLGELSQAVPSRMQIEKTDTEITVTRPDRARRGPRAARPDAHAHREHGRGRHEGFEKHLEIQGVGYRAQLKGTDLELAVGYSHAVTIKPRKGIEFDVPQPTQIVVKGIDKQMVGQTAAEIRKVRPPEPYKGKGIRYAGEQVRRKVGKRA